ncbi:unnamed protein product [Enterobius vermicularis]|uniref:Transmembrane protein 65 n=1 Tax=Enterobius vermicularis TaxID=51028 RepID=A0A0N4UYY9_ENTVE|nr:unnamed protein product [Enterobius vermicularis]
MASVFFRCRGLTKIPELYEPVIGRMKQVRSSCTGAYKQLPRLKIESDEKASALVNQLRPAERSLLLKALEEVSQENVVETNKDSVPLTKQQIRQLFAVNLAPFIGFGILDNMIMIFTGEYIELTLGAWLAISTMAAAALGNIVSDVGGIGLAHYVESLVSKAGIKHPVLTAEQLESSCARTVGNTARALGLVIGCLIGMFPLLFFDCN